MKKRGIDNGVASIASHSPNPIATYLPAGGEPRPRPQPQPMPSRHKSASHLTPSWHSSVSHPFLVDLDPQTGYAAHRHDDSAKTATAVDALVKPTWTAKVSRCPALVDVLVTATDGQHHPASFKDALLRPRTFKPRFPPNARSGGQVWYDEGYTGRQRRPAPLSPLLRFGVLVVRRFPPVPPGLSSSKLRRRVIASTASPPDTALPLAAIRLSASPACALATRCVTALQPAAPLC